MASNDTEARIVRIESRLVQLMLHLGLDPYDHRYQQDQPRTLSPKCLSEIRGEGAEPDATPGNIQFLRSYRS